MSFIGAGTVLIDKSIYLNESIIDKVESACFGFLVLLASLKLLSLMLGGLNFCGVM